MRRTDLLQFATLPRLLATGLPRPTRHTLPSVPTCLRTDPPEFTVEGEEERTNGSHA